MALHRFFRNTQDVLKLRLRRTDHQSASCQGNPQLNTKTKSMSATICTIHSSSKHQALLIMPKALWLEFPID